jgi:hypothetical protein
MKRQTLKHLHHHLYGVLLDPAVGKIRTVRAENPKRDPKKPRSVSRSRLNVCLLDLLLVLGLKIDWVSRRVLMPAGILDYETANVDEGIIPTAVHLGPNQE